MEITTSKQGEVAVVALAGRFDAQSAGQVDQSLQANFQEGGRKLLVDMNRVEYVSSAGLRVLLAAAKKSGNLGGRMVLCGLQPYVLEVFEVAGFTSIFQILPDAASALQSF
ncbi:MAG: STAS domain-containing protein [Desulfarculus sp.]|nr:STAS domain-containing protein [Desulfarculus sp.]